MNRQVEMNQGVFEGLGVVYLRPTCWCVLTILECISRPYAIHLLQRIVLVVLLAACYRSGGVWAAVGRRVPRMRKMLKCIILSSSSMCDYGIFLYNSAYIMILNSDYKKSFFQTKRRRDCVARASVSASTVWGNVARARFGGSCLFG